MNQVSVESFQGRALALMMGIDRIFLFRELFVALAMVLVAAGRAAGDAQATRRR